MRHEIRQQFVLLVLVLFGGLGWQGYAQDTLQLGYGVVRLESGTGVPESTAVVGLKNGDGVLVTEAGIGAVEPIERGRIFVDAARTQTLLALVNPGTGSALVNLVLRDGSGTTVGEKSLPINPGEHVLQFADELGTGPGFEGSLTFENGAGLGATAIRLGTNGFGEPVFTTLPVVNLESEAGTGETVLPLVAVGGGFRTQVMLVNPGGESISGRIRLAGSDGTPLEVDWDGAPASEASYQIASHGVYRAELSGDAGVFGVGYARVTPEAGVTPSASAVVQLWNGEALVTEAGIGEAAETTAARISLDNVGRQTVVAIANRGTASAAVEFVLQDRFGAEQERETQTIAAGGYFLATAQDLFPTVASGYTGQIEIRSSVPVAPVTLGFTFNTRGEVVLATLPVADLTGPQTAAMKVFPTVVIGAGFETRMVFLNGETSQVGLEFYEANGTSMTVPLGLETSNQFTFDFAANEGQRLFPGDTATVATLSLRDLVTNQSSEEVNVNVDGSVRLRVLVLDSSGKSRDDFAVTYSSLSTDIASVDTSGNIQGITTGFSTLTLSSGNAIATATIAVTDVVSGVTGFDAIGVAQDESGTLYLASSESHTVLAAADLTQAPELYAGVEGSPGLKNAARLESQFSNPAYLSFSNAEGDLYVSDGSNHVIRRIQPGNDGQVETLSGTGVAGNADGLSASFDNPQGIALDGRGNIWVADSGNHTIRRINLESGETETLAGLAGNAGLADGVGSAARFNTPTGIALEVESLAQQLQRELSGDPPPPIRMLVTDSNNGVVRRVWETGQVDTITSLASASALRAGEGNSKSSAELAATALQFSAPAGIASDAFGNIYVTEPGIDQVRVILPNGRVRRLGQRNTFQEPRGVLVTDDGKVLVSDRQSLARSIEFGAPTIGSISPLKILNTGGESVIIRGSNFAPGTLVLLGRVGIDATVESSGRITFTAPPAESGIRTLTILNRGGVAQTPLWVDAVGLTETAAGNITTVAGGSDFVGDGLKARQAAIGSPFATAFVRGRGAMLIVDRGNNRIRRYDFKTGIITTIAGTGDRESSGDGGPAVAAALNRPADVLVDRVGNVFIAEDRGHRIRMIDAATAVITTIAGTGARGYSGDGGPAVSAQMSRPIALALDAEGRLLVAEFTNHVIRRIDLSDQTISTIAGTGEQGFSGDGGPATAAKLNLPQGIVPDASGNLLISDSRNNRIRRVDTGTGVITTIAGTGEQDFSGDGGPATAASLNQPGGIAADASGNLYLADRRNNRVRRIDSETGLISTIAGGDSQGFAGNNGPATDALLHGPQSVTVNRNGNFIVIADTRNNRVRRVRGRDDSIRTLAGNGEARIIGDDAPATAAGLYGPSDLAFDLSGNLVVADRYNHRVRSIDSGSRRITSIAGGGNEGLRAGRGSGGYGGDDGPALDASLDEPNGVLIDAAGNVVIVDRRNNRIREVDRATGNIRTIAGTGGQGDSGDGGPAVEAEIFEPRGIASDSAGNLYFSDTGNNRVRRIDRETGVITTVAGNGPRGFSGDGGSGVEASLDGPVGLAFDAADNLFIADVFNHRIRRVDAVTGVITTVAGSGAVGRGEGSFSGDEGLATEAQLNFPIDVPVDTAGNLWIADFLNNRVRRVSGTTGLITTVAGSGPFGSRVEASGDNGPATSATLKFPRAVVLDSNGNLFIATSAGRVRAVRGIGNQ